MEDSHFFTSETRQSDRHLDTILTENVEPNLQKPIADTCNDSVHINESDFVRYPNIISLNDSCRDSAIYIKTSEICDMVKKRKRG